MDSKTIHDDPYRRIEELEAEIRRLKAEAESASRSTEGSRYEEMRRLRLFIEHAPVSVAMFDREMRYIAVSKRWLTDYRLGDQDLIGARHYDVFPEIPESWKIAHRRGLAGEVLSKDGDRFDRMDGSVQWQRWEVHPWREDSGEVGGIVIFTEDTTARRLAERQVEELARFPWENPNPVLRIAADGTLLYANTSSTHLCENLDWRLDRKISPEWREMVRDVLEKGTVRRVEAACGDVIYSLGIAPIRDPGYVNIYAIDITELKQTEAELRKSQSRLEAVFAAIPHALIEYDVDLRAIRANAVAMKVTGLKSLKFTRNEAVAGMQFTHDDGRLVKKEELVTSKALRGETVLGDIYSMTDAEGVHRYISMFGAPVRMDGRIIGAVVLWHDITELKQTQLALAASEKNYREILETANSVIIRWDRRGTIRFINEFGARHFGYLPEELIGRDVGVLVPDVEELTGRDLTELVADIVAHPEHHIYNPNENIRKNGERIWVAWSNKAVLDDDGRVREILAVGTDITALKFTEAALRESRAKLEAALASMTDAVFISDVEGHFIQFNEAFATFHRFRNKAECAHTFSEYPAILDVCFENGEPAPPDQWAVSRALRGETVTNAEYGLRRKDTGESWIGSYSFGPIRDKDGKITGSVVVGRDVTEAKRAQETIKRSEARLRTTFQVIPDALVITERDGRLIDVNEAFTKLLGFSAEEAIGKISVELGVWHDVADRKGFLEALDGDGEIRDFETRFKAKSGKLLDILISAQVLDLAAGPYSIAVIRDVTEKKRAEVDRARLEEQYAQAQKLESIGRLAGGVAHDLNNLLSPILGYGEMLLEDMLPQEELKPSVQLMIDAGVRARDLVRQLLAFSRKQVLEFKPLDLNKVVTDFEKLLRRTIHEDILIETRLADALPLVRGDIGQLEQVIMNLAVNAQDAMEKGGLLSIETAVVELDESYAAKRPGVTPGEHVALIISDSGQGMDVGTRDHLFEPFFTTKESGKGTGLGLATVYGIVKQHGGNIWVYSEKGKGATFKIYLPIFRGSEAPSKKKIRKSTETRGVETILLVEDNREVRELARTILARRGYTTLSAKNGLEALEMANGHDGVIDLVLTDVVMPGMNGRELYEKLRSDHPDLKVLFMSGYADNVIVHKGILDEGVNFIEKPFAVSGLTAKVRKVLDEE